MCKVLGLFFCFFFLHWHALENVKGQLVHLYWPILLSSCYGHGSLNIDGDINRIKSYFWPFRICNLMIFL